RAAASPGRGCEFSSERRIGARNPAAGVLYRYSALPATRLRRAKEPSISTALSQASLPALLPSVHLPRPKDGLAGRLRAGPFVLLPRGALVGVFVAPLPWTAAGLCAGLYVARMFGITGGYHRYFAPRASRTSRFFQFVLAWLGCSAMQKGPLWWA